MFSRRVVGGAGFSAIVNDEVGICVFMYPLLLSTMRTVSVYTLVRELLSTMTFATYESSVSRRQVSRWE